MEREEAIALLERYSNYDGMGIQNLAGCKEAMKVAVESLKEAFPELAESEDERMLREIKRYIKEQGNKPTGLPNGTAAVADMLAWLEKQKNLDKMIVVSPEVWDGAINDAYENGKKDSEKQKEQKPVEPNWIHHKVDLSNCSEEYIKAYYDGWNNCNQQHSQHDAEQKPAEWSEEDEDMLNSCISSIEEAKENRYAYKETDGDTSYDHEIAWLKSLRPVSKESLQSHWKPSEEQMEVLAMFSNLRCVSRQEAATLESLYNDLKKRM